MKGTDMKLKHLAIAISLITLSAPVLARTIDCTSLDKAHWIPEQEMRSKFEGQGYEVLNFSSTNTCYKAVLKARKGRKFQGIYDPVEGHPLRRQSI
jgi:hypothetical protein